MSSTEAFDARPKARLNRLPSNPEARDSSKAVGPGRFPSWLHRKLPKGGNLHGTDKVMKEHRLHTVCEEAKCPNRLECWSNHTATFLVMGKECTRRCGFCDIDFAANPVPLDADEPQRIVESVKALGLKHVVITMVARDDLQDGGAAHLAAILRAIRQESPESTLEVLTSDFEGSPEALDVVMAEAPEVFNHNIETVRALSPRVRHKATYDRTLDVLRHVSRHPKSSTVKSGLMVGLGETEEQVQETLRDLKEVGCRVVTIGQYLQASRNKLLVKSFVTPEQFKAYEDYGKSIGLAHVYSGPFVRSSYNAHLFA